MVILNIPGDNVWLFSVGFRVECCVEFWAEVPISVVNAEMPSLVTCTVVVGDSCVAVTLDISVVPLLNSVELLETCSVVIGAVSPLAVVASLVVILVVWEGLAEPTTVKWYVNMTSWDEEVSGKVVRFVGRVSCVPVWLVVAGIDSLAVRVIMNEQTPRRGQL